MAKSQETDFFREDPNTNTEDSNLITRRQFLKRLTLTVGGLSFLGVLANTRVGQQILRSLAENKFQQDALEHINSITHHERTINLTNEDVPDRWTHRYFARRDVNIYKESGTNRQILSANITYRAGVHKNSFDSSDPNSVPMRIPLPHFKKVEGINSINPANSKVDATKKVDYLLYANLNPHHSTGERHSALGGVSILKDGRCAVLSPEQKNSTSTPVENFCEYFIVCEGNQTAFDAQCAELTLLNDVAGKSIINSPEYSSFIMTMYNPKNKKLETRQVSTIPDEENPAFAPYLGYSIRELHQIATQIFHESEYSTDGFFTMAIADPGISSAINVGSDLHHNTAINAPIRANNSSNQYYMSIGYTGAGTYGNPYTESTPPYYMGIQPL